MVLTRLESTHPRAQPAWKRSLDLALIVSSTPLTLPLIAGAWVIARLDTRANGLFWQERVGAGGRLFWLAKIRTMSPKAENQGTVTLASDPRITRVGRFLRRCKIDELPQVWNVLRGEMSIVGPRPTIAADYAKMSDIQRGRCSVAPGLTGLAQISGNTTLPWPDRIHLDLEYIAKMSPCADLSIIARTVALILMGQAETRAPSSDEWTARNDQ